MLSVLASNRYLIRELFWRDVRSRYVGSAVGLLWSIVNPLALLAIYTFVARIFLWKLGEEGSAQSLAPRIFCALLPWIAFSEGVTRSAASFLENANLIQKQRFPLEVLPLKTVLSAVFHQLIGTAVLVAYLIAAGGMSWANAWALPLLLSVQIAMSLGAGLAVASLNVFVRDIGQLLGLAFLALFWATPIVYQRGMAQTTTALLLGLNPLTHMAEAYRWAFLGTAGPSWQGLAYWVGSSLIALAAGRAILNRTRKDIADFL